MQNKSWLSSSHGGGGGLKYIHEAFAKNRIAPLDPNADEFAKELSASPEEMPAVAALSSDTKAIHLALILTEISYSYRISNITAEIG